MTRIISFSDGFTSSSTPVVTGGAQENYTILNNQSSPLSLFTIDSADFKSAFISFELEREDVSNEYRQVGNIALSYDGTNWLYTLGNYQGSDIIVTTLSLAKDVKLEISTSVGVGDFKYSSGNMGASYSGNLRISITRIAIA